MLDTGNRASAHTQQIKDDARTQAMKPYRYGGASLTSFHKGQTVKGHDDKTRYIIWLTVTNS
jgi:hypothetical protein